MCPPDSHRRSPPDLGERARNRDSAERDGGARPLSIDASCANLFFYGLTVDEREPRCCQGVALGALGAGYHA